MKSERHKNASRLKRVGIALHWVCYSKSKSKVNTSSDWYSYFRIVSCSREYVNKNSYSKSRNSRVRSSICKTRFIRKTSLSKGVRSRKIWSHTGLQANFVRIKSRFKNSDSKVFSKKKSTNSQTSWRKCSHRWILQKLWTKPTINNWMTWIIFKSNLTVRLQLAMPKVLSTLLTRASDRKISNLVATW